VVILHRKNPNEGMLQRGAEQLLLALVTKNTQGPTGETVIRHIVGHYTLEGRREE